MLRVKKVLSESLISELGVDEMLVHKIMNDGLSVYGGEEYAELALFLGCLQALSMLHQTHHWQSKGGTYYGDHLLFQRLYEETVAEVDTIAEKAVGVGARKLVGYLSQLIHMKNFLMDIRQNTENAKEEDKFALRSLFAEVCFLSLGELIMSKLQEDGKLTRGIEQALGNVLDKHEGHVYLLKERVI